MFIHLLLQFNHSLINIGYLFLFFNPDLYLQTLYRYLGISIHAVSYTHLLLSAIVTVSTFSEAHFISSQKVSFVFRNIPRYFTELLVYITRRCTIVGILLPLRTIVRTCATWQLPVQYGIPFNTRFSCQ